MPLHGHPVGGMGRSTCRYGSVDLLSELWTPGLPAASGFTVSRMH